MVPTSLFVHDDNLWSLLGPSMGSDPSRTRLGSDLVILGSKHISDLKLKDQTWIQK